MTERDPEPIVDLGRGWTNPVPFYLLMGGAVAGSAGIGYVLFWAGGRQDMAPATFWLLCACMLGLLVAPVLRYIILDPIRIDFANRQVEVQGEQLGFHQVSELRLTREVHKEREAGNAAARLVVWVATLRGAFVREAVLTQGPIREVYPPI